MARRGCGRKFTTITEMATIDHGNNWLDRYCHQHWRRAVALSNTAMAASGVGGIAVHGRGRDGNEDCLCDDGVVRAKWRSTPSGRLSLVMVDESDAELYRKYCRGLMSFATTLCGPAGAEDVFSTAVLSAMTSAHWSAVTNKRAYLYRCVLNEASRARRRNDRRMSHNLASVADEVSPLEVDQDVLMAVRKLTMRQRAVVFLTYWVDLAPSEVARTLDCSQRTVERELMTARRRLEVLLK